MSGIISVIDVVATPIFNLMDSANNAESYSESLSDSTCSVETNIEQSPSIQEITTNVHKSSAIANDAMNQTQQTNDLINNLSQSSKDISKITTVILILLNKLICWH